MGKTNESWGALMRRPQLQSLEIAAGPEDVVKVDLREKIKSILTQNLVLFRIFIDVYLV